MNATTLHQRLQGLLDHIRSGKVIEAMNEFYDHETVMQDNANPPTKGLAANIERAQTLPAAGLDAQAGAIRDTAPTASSQPSTPARLSRTLKRRERPTTTNVGDEAPAPAVALPGQTTAGGTADAPELKSPPGAKDAR